jgi:hypothetical protein
MTYRGEHFNDADRSAFLKAVAAEGVPLGPYIDRGLHREPWVDNVLNSRVYRSMYSKQRLQQYREANRLPNCDQVCRDTVIIWASGPLLGSREDMDDVVDAIVKVYENRDHLKSIS